MASVDFKKFKSVTQVKAKLRHCDREQRLKTEWHSNDDIDKQKTNRNTQLANRDYYTTCQLFDERLAFLDEQPGANKRKDKVICFGLEVPAPKGMDTKTAKEWFNKVYKLICKQYGSQNVMNIYIHRDEQHEYINSETNEKCMSREHLQAYVVPEHNGKLNGKWFSSRNNMIQLNNSIHEMTENDYGLQFMDGSKKKSRKSVEALKRHSEALQAEERAKALEERTKALESEIEALESQITELVRLKEQAKSVLFSAYSVDTAKETALKISDTVKNGYVSTIRERLSKANKQNTSRVSHNTQYVDVSTNSYEDDNEMDF